MELIQQCYGYLFWGVLAALALCVIAVLVYILKTHLTVDRIIGINLIGTLVVIIICILAFIMDEGYLADIAMIYTMLSFLAVVLLSKVYMGIYREKRRRAKESQAQEGNEHA